MKTIQSIEYVCEKCQTHYANWGAALLCENRTVTQDKGVKVGDLVIVTNGDGNGERARVASIGVCSKDYGKRVSQKYWHTVYVFAHFVDSYGSRMLLFDDYSPYK